MKKLSRRNFLLILNTVGLGVAGTILFDRHLDTAPLPTNVDPAMPAPLLVDKLEAFVSALFIAYPLSSTRHYRGFFQYQGSNEPDKLGWFQEFVAILDENATQVAGDDFLSIDDNARRDVINKIVNINASPMHITRNSRVIARVLSHIFTFYMYTDAHLILGYSGWPGSPRGLEAYQNAPNDNILQS